MKEKYKQWCLYRQFGSIRTIGYTQSLGVIRKNGILSSILSRILDNNLKNLIFAK